MVQAGTIYCEPRAQRVPGRERLDQLELRVAKVEVGEADGAAVQDFGADDAKTHAITPDFKRLVGGGNDDGEMIEAKETQWGNWSTGITRSKSFISGSSAGGFRSEERQAENPVKVPGQGRENDRSDQEPANAIIGSRSGHFVIGFRQT
jgi:hypothetical protein